MAVNKKYYWLKLKDNFFDTDEMIVLESMQDGYIYSNILLKLYLRSLKNDGKLMFNDCIPYNSTILANVTRHSVGDIEKAIKVFKELGLIEILDNGAIYMIQIQNFIGQSSTEADRIRSYRQKIINEKLLSSNVQEDEYKCTPEIEKEKELDIDNIDNKVILEVSKANSSNQEKVINLYHNLCPSFPKVMKVSESRKKAIKARLNKYTIEDFEILFEKAEASDFLKGNNNRNWRADFDWLIKDTNLPKVLEGKYDNNNKTYTPNYSSNDFFSQ
ncbi:MAG: phage replisome organizer N-terminal domain-containing protein [Eubacteriales bacterium]|nr:phage replisome organizer N-terminal domain-containing protein [Eubacteriales bacterium]